MVVVVVVVGRLVGWRSKGRKAKRRRRAYCQAIHPAPYFDQSSVGQRAVMDLKNTSYEKCCVLSKVYECNEWLHHYMV
jgi:hypothetical protein